MNNLPEGYQTRLISKLQPYKEKWSYRRMAKAMGAKTDQDVQNLAQRVYKWFSTDLSYPLRDDAFEYIQTMTGDSNLKAYVENGVKSPTIEERLSKLEKAIAC